jgi:hypothetical protein
MFNLLAASSVEYILSHSVFSLKSNLYYPQYKVAIQGIAHILSVWGGLALKSPLLKKLPSVSVAYPGIFFGGRCLFKYLGGRRFNKFS